MHCAVHGSRHATPHTAINRIATLCSVSNLDFTLTAVILICPCVAASACETPGGGWPLCDKHGVSAVVRNRALGCVLEHVALRRRCTGIRRVYIRHVVGCTAAWQLPPRIAFALALASTSSIRGHTVWVPLRAAEVSASDSAARSAAACRSPGWLGLALRAAMAAHVATGGCRGVPFPSGTMTVHPH